MLVLRRIIKYKTPKHGIPICSMCAVLVVGSTYIYIDFDSCGMGGGVSCGFDLPDDGSTHCETLAFLRAFERFQFP